MTFVYLVILTGLKMLSTSELDSSEWLLLLLSDDLFFFFFPSLLFPLGLALLY
jgi:hypothetical protein